MASTLATYIVSNMAVSRPGKAAKERNPERLYTVKGTFHSVKRDAKGTPIVDQVLTFKSKNIDESDALAEGFALDVENGILTLPVGTRGRQASPSLSADDIAADLAFLRNSAE